MCVCCGAGGHIISHSISLCWPSRSTETAAAQHTVYIPAAPKGRDV